MPSRVVGVDVLALCQFLISWCFYFLGFPLTLHDISHLSPRIPRFSMRVFSPWTWFNILTMVTLGSLSDIFSIRVCLGVCFSLVGLLLSTVFPSGHGSYFCPLLLWMSHNSWWDVTQCRRKNSRHWGQWHLRVETCTAVGFSAFRGGGQRGAGRSAVERLDVPMAGFGALQSPVAVVSWGPEAWSPGVF